MKLTPEQITQIKTFVADKGIIYPDVQLEIIDHVASRGRRIDDGRSAS